MIVFLVVMFVLCVVALCFTCVFGVLGERYCC